MLKLGVDVGGTFTDLCLLDADSGQVWIDKLPSTPADQSLAFMDGILQVLEKVGKPAHAVDFLVHGTTVATNALLEHKGAKTALVTTEGFRDVLEIGTQQRAELYSVVQSKPPALVSRHLRRDVPERVAYDGAVVTPLDEASARRVLEELRDEGIESLAVCLLFSFMNDSHERHLADLASDIMPHVMVSLSSSLSPEYREYWRMSTTTVNAYVMPPVFRYIDRLEQQLRDNGITAGLHVMQSTGGLMTAATTKERPVKTILSGPVGGVVGGTFFGVSAGFEDLVTFDMGGTSCDVATVVRGEPGRAHLKEVEGYPLRTPMVDIETIGAGGGSIAHVDAGGALKVGPESAAAVPGPACYGRGGVHATVSDANLVVGVLGADTVLGRDLALDVAAAREAVRRDVAEPLGLSVEDAAAGIIAIANANMLRAIRLITVQKGLDPRTFSLVAFGGAGPMHACAVAREARIPRVVVPPHPGITSAVGLLMTDIRHPMMAPFIVPTDKADFAAAEDLLEKLRAEAERKLREDGIPPEAISFRRFADMRYHGQAYELTIPCDEALAGPGADGPEGTVRRLVASFHAHHEQAYGHHAESEPTQFVNLRVEGVGTVPRGAWRERIAPRYEHDRRRTVFVKGSGWLDAPVLDRSRLDEHKAYRGPLIVEQLDTTVWIPPGDVADVDTHGNIIVEVAK
jgi:N-methylhydantoinase A